MPVRRPSHRCAVVFALALALGLGACDDGEDVAVTDDATPDPPTEPTPDSGREATPTPATTPSPATPDEEALTLAVELSGLADPIEARYALWVEADGDLERLAAVDGPEDGAATAEVQLAAEPDRVLVAVEDDAADTPLTLLAGDVDDGSAELAVDHPAALGAALAEAEGTFLLGSPSDQAAPEQAGVWFLRVTDDGNVPSLELSEAPEGWVYEGWASREGTTLPAGRFPAADAPSSGAPHDGPDGVPSLPGGDFVADPPDGVDFPWELHGATVTVALAPEGFDPGAPLVAVLEGDTPDPADHHVDYDLESPAERPAGTATLRR